MTLKALVPIAVFSVLVVAAAIVTTAVVVRRRNSEGRPKTRAQGEDGAANAVYYIDVGVDNGDNINGSAGAGHAIAHAEYLEFKENYAKTGNQK